MSIQTHTPTKNKIVVARNNVGLKHPFRNYCVYVLATKLKLANINSSKS